MPEKAVLDRTAIARRFSAKITSRSVLRSKISDCADGNKDVRIEKKLLLSRQQAKPNQAVKFSRKTDLIRLCRTYKRYGSSPINRMPRHGQIAYLGLNVNQNSNLHSTSQHRAS